MVYSILLSYLALGENNSTKAKNIGIRLTPDVSIGLHAASYRNYKRSVLRTSEGEFGLIYGLQRVLKLL